MPLRLFAADDAVFAARRFITVSFRDFAFTPMAFSSILMTLI